MPHHISSKTTKKLVHFADSANDVYTYGSDRMPSPVATCSSQKLLQRSSTSWHQHAQTYHRFRSLNDVPSPEYTNSSPSPLPSFSSPEYSPYSPLTIHTVPHLPSSLSRQGPTQPPPTPNGLRHPDTLPPVGENSSETSTTSELHESLRPSRLSIDLSQDISSYILTLRDKPDTSLWDPPTDMILVSRYLPWRIRISPGSVSDIVVALYRVLRTRVTDEEMEAVASKDAMNTFAKRVERVGEEERKEGCKEGRCFSRLHEDCL
ncbi:hypothetical protein F5146DRAFT_1067796, partial [Armillaria mellea]